jgi:transposase
MDKQQSRRKFSPEVRARAVRMAIEHRGDHAPQWAAIVSIAAKIGCPAQTLHNWVRQAERDQGLRGGMTTDDHERVKALERENRELRQANEILRKASAYFAQAETRGFSPKRRPRPPLWARPKHLCTSRLSSPRRTPEAVPTRHSVCR